METTYPFYIYDQHKSHGYIFSSKDNLYHHCDLHNIKKYSPYKSIIHHDLRPIMDLANDIIPIDSNLVLIPSSKQYRHRTSDDHFTYSLKSPQYSDLLDTYMIELIPSDSDRSLLRNYILSSLISYIPHSFLIVNGSSTSIDILFGLLFKLNPLITFGRTALYCESNVNKTTLDEIHQSRLVMCNIGTRTLRVASQPDKKYNHPIQYHGIVYQLDNNYSQKIPDKTINISMVKSIQSFDSSEILGWFLS